VLIKLKEKKKVHNEN